MQEERDANNLGMVLFVYYSVFVLEPFSLPGKSFEVESRTIPDYQEL